LGNGRLPENSRLGGREIAGLEAVYYLLKNKRAKGSDTRLTQEETIEAVIAKIGFFDTGEVKEGLLDIFTLFYERPANRLDLGRMADKVNSLLRKHFNTDFV
jgi:hypothetical protein